MRPGSPRIAITLVRTATPTSQRPGKSVLRVSVTVLVAPAVNGPVDQRARNRRPADLAQLPEHHRRRPHLRRASARRTRAWSCRRRRRRGASPSGRPRRAIPSPPSGTTLKRSSPAGDRSGVGVFAPAAGVALTWDQAGIEESRSICRMRTSRPATSAAASSCRQAPRSAPGRSGRCGNEKTKAIGGGSAARAACVPGRSCRASSWRRSRERPDGSDFHSFPSGHAASAFATASVLGRHLGWKAGATGLQLRRLRRDVAHVRQQAPHERRHHGRRRRVLPRGVR